MWFWLFDEVESVDAEFEGEGTILSCRFGVESLLVRGFTQLFHPVLMEAHSQVGMDDHDVLLFTICLCRLGMKAFSYTSLE